MKPEKLVLEGVYSYRSRTEIDFSTLCRAELFGIFGRVGCGKSAILEAVTYVLYGKIERLSDRGLYYNMMNLASNSMHIDFEFTHKSDRYRFTFDAKRNKKDFSKVETPQRSAYRLSGGEWLPLFDHGGSVSADEIIGLNYDNFRRTVIVPQGRFQEFLHLERKKRTDMLKELFQLDRFDLFSKASSLYSKNAQRIASVEGALSALGEVSEEDIEKAENEVSAAEKLLPGLSGELLKKAEELKSMDELEGLYAEKNRCNDDLENRLQNAEYFRLKKESLAEYEKCIALFKSGVDVAAHIDEERQRAEKKLEEAGIQAERVKNNLRTAEADIDKYRQEYERCPEKLKEAEWLSQLSGLEEYRKTVSRSEAGIKEKEDLVNNLTAELNKLENELISARKQVESLSDYRLSLDQMNSLLNVFRGITSVDKEIDLENRRLENELKNLAKIEKESAEIADIEDEEKKLAEIERLFNKTKLDSEIKKGLAELSAGLKDGEPCPVCGSAEHPAPAEITPDTETELKDDEEYIKSEKQRIRLKAEKAAALAADKKTAEAAAADIKSRLEQRSAERVELLSQLPEDSFSADDPQLFFEEYDSFMSGLNEKEMLQKKVSELGEAADEIKRQLNSGKEIISGFKMEAAAAEARIDTIENAIDQDFLNENVGKASGALKQESEALKKRAELVSAEYSAAQDRRNNAAVEKEKALSEYSMLEQQAVELSGRRADMLKDLDEKAVKEGFNSVDQISAVLAKNIDIETEKAEIKAYDESIADLKSRIAEIVRKTGKRKYDADTHSAVKQDAEMLTQRLEHEKSLLIGLKKDLKDMKDRYGKKSAFEREAEQLELRRNNITTLKNLFSGNKFINYAATVYLRELCEAANVRFRKLTSEALRLELDESNDFIIRDYLNGGKTRSVKTLSGGRLSRQHFHCRWHWRTV